MKLYIEGVGLRAPGLADWNAGREVFSGQTEYRHERLVISSNETLPAAERRRATNVVKLAITVCSEALMHAGARAEDTPSIFSSSGGDGETITAILEVLATDARELSPTRFHNSVHNAPSGYWGIATRSYEASTSLCAYDFSFAAGLLEAASQVLTTKRAVLLASYDLAYPEPLHAVRPISYGFAVALLLSPRMTARTLAELSVSLNCHGGEPTKAVHPDLEALRQRNPAARSLPLLTAVAGTAEQQLSLEYIAGNSILISVVPFRATAG